MALTEQSIKEQKVLETLTPEQISALTTLSQNDETIVVGKKFGEIHGEYDTLMATIGYPKQQGIKSSDHVKTIISDLKTKAESTKTLSTEINTLKSEIETYKEKIKSGQGSELIAQQLKDAQKQLSDTKALLDTEKANWSKEKDQFTSEISQVKLNTEFEKAVAGLKFKATIPESLQKIAIDSAKAAILATNKAEWVENNGNKVLVFRDAAGNIVTNPANAYNAMTPQELIKAQLKDVLDDGKQQTGTGTGEPGRPPVVQLTDLTGAKSQEQADEIIVKHLLQKGMVRSNPEFQKEFTKIRVDNKVSSLPIQ